ncbi:MAG: hypothetical protein ACRDN9_04295 [Streptosporangiaceae bacterium]
MEEAAGGGGGGSFSGIDPQRLHGMISSLRGGANTLHDAKTLKGRFAHHGVDTGALTHIERIASWVDDQMPGLKRRCTLAYALDDGPSAGTFVQVPEPPLMSAEEARKQGKTLAKRLSSLSSSEEGAKKIHEVAKELAKHKNDPDFLTAFYAQLHAQNELQILPSLIASTGSDTAKADLKAISQTLGTAVSAPYSAPGFDAVKKSFTEPPPEGANATAWNRGALLAYGDFPSDWLAKVARANALDRFAADPNQDFRGCGPTEMQAFGLPQSTIALYLHALGHNGAAARQALTHMGGAEHHRSLPENFKLFLDAAKGRGTGDEISNALGEAMEAGSGVHDETMGLHSKAASRFAFDVITSMGDYEQDDGVPWSMKDSMGEVAASYAPEIIAGSRRDDAPGRSSGFGKPDDWDSIPGLDPNFYLSPGDTYKFLKTFGNNDQLSKLFDDAMAGLQQRLLHDAAVADKKAIAEGTQDPENFGDTAAALGFAGGLEYNAQLKVRGDMDAFDKKVQGYTNDIFNYTVGKLPGSNLAWDAIKYAAGKGFAEVTTPDHTRVDHLENEADTMRATVTYDMARSLYEADYPMRHDPPSSIMEYGHLKPFAQIVSEGHLEALNDWFDENHERGSVSFDDKGEDSSQRMEGTRDGGVQTAEGVDGDFVKD